jgi:hypothetical protein
VVLQIALENSGGALKMKVAEVPLDRSAENLLTPLIIDILESEPMLSVSKYSWQISNVEKYFIRETQFGVLLYYHFRTRIKTVISRVFLI